MRSPKIVHPLPAALACAAIALAAPAAAAELNSIAFLPAVQSITQNGRVQMVNLGSAVGPNGSPPDPCKVTVHFVDADGKDVGPAQDVSLARGSFTSVAAPVFVKTGLPVALRAHIFVTSKSKFPPDPCHGLHAGYEVFDTATLETKFVSPGAIRGFNPQPDPPGVVGR
jgi:hypothetical protein